MLTWELNEASLPRELDMGSRHFEINWIPILDAESKVSHIQLVVSDVTEKRQLQSAVEVEQRKFDRFYDKINEIFSGRLAKIAPMVAELRDNLQNYAEMFLKLDKITIKQRLHTIKGNARTTGLRQLADATHTLEDSLELSSEQLAMVKNSWIEMIKDYVELIFVRLGSENIQKGTESLYDIVQEQIPVLRRNLKAAQISLEQVSIIDRFDRWSPGLLKDLAEMLLHALTNAVDHGFVLAKAKGLPTTQARIEVIAERQDQFLIVKVLDNGAGIDWQALTAKAQALDFAYRNREELSELLFRDSISLAAVTSITSGRGVGLSAIGAIAQNLGGKVTIANGENDIGTCLSICLPLAAATSTDTNDPLRNHFGVLQRTGA